MVDPIAANEENPVINTSIYRSSAYPPIYSDQSIREARELKISHQKNRNEPHPKIRLGQWFIKLEIIACDRFGRTLICNILEQ